MVTERYPPTPFTDIPSDGVVRIAAAQQNVRTAYIGKSIPGTF